MSSETNDHREIRALVERQFESLSWSETRAANWRGFADDFFGDAPLFPGARPVKPSNVSTFLSRMKGLSEGDLKTLDERCVGCNIHVHGNVAVAMAICELTENGDYASHNIEAMLLVKEEGSWKIAAQGWDSVTDRNEIAPDLFD